MLSTDHLAAFAAERTSVSFVPYVDKQKWRCRPTDIDQNKLIVGGRNERYELDVAGAEMARPRQPIYVRPAIREAYRSPRWRFEKWLQARLRNFELPSVPNLFGYGLICGVALWFVIIVVPQTISLAQHGPVVP